MNKKKIIIITAVILMIIGLGLYYYFVVMPKSRINNNDLKEILDYADIHPDDYVTPGFPGWEKRKEILIAKYNSFIESGLSKEQALSKTKEYDSLTYQQ